VGEDQGSKLASGEDGVPSPPEASYLPLLSGPHGRRLDNADMFDTMQECVLDWSNSYIVSNTTTKNINDLLEYYGKLEQQASSQEKSQKPAISIIASRNSNQPEIRINATKETKTNAMEIIATMKSPFAPIISSVDIQMPNAAILAIHKE
jgi:hypothetical protein